jgi:hypothetical protein
MLRHPNQARGRTSSGVNGKKIDFGFDHEFNLVAIDEFDLVERAAQGHAVDRAGEKIHADLGTGTGVAQYRGAGGLAHGCGANCGNAGNLTISFLEYQVLVAFFDAQVLDDTADFF